MKRRILDKIAVAVMWYATCAVGLAGDFTTAINGNFMNGGTWGNTAPGVAGVDYPDLTGVDNVTLLTGRIVTDDLASGVDLRQKTIRMQSGAWNRTGAGHSFSQGDFDVGDCKGNADSFFTWDGTVPGADLVLETTTAGPAGEHLRVLCDARFDLTATGATNSANLVFGQGGGPNGNVAGFMTVDGGRVFLDHDLNDVVFDGDNQSTLTLTNNAIFVSSTGLSDMWVNDGGGTVRISGGTFLLDDLMFFTDAGNLSRFNFIIEGSVPGSVTFGAIVSDFAGRNTGEGTLRFNLDANGVTPLALSKATAIDNVNAFADAFTISVQEGVGIDSTFTQNVALIDFNGSYVAANLDGVLEFNVDGNLYGDVVDGTVVTMTVAGVDLEFAVRFDDTRPGANSDEVWLEFIPGPATDLVITTTVIPQVVVDETNLVYTIVVSNASPVDAFNVVVTDIVAAAVNFESATPMETGATNDLVWFDVGNLPAGATVSFQVTVVLEPTIFSPMGNLARVWTSTRETNLVNNSFVVLVSFVDTDGDGEFDYYDEDDDDDGFSDEYEIAVGTDPKDPNSFLALTLEIARGANKNQRIVSFQSQPARTYNIQASASLYTGPWVDVAADIPGDGTIISVPHNTSSDRMYYRLELE